MRRAQTRFRINLFVSCVRQFRVCNPVTKNNFVAMTEKDANAAATPKKSKSASKAKKPKTAPSHPKVADMVTSAITSLKERGGSSLAAIKKYIASNYKVDADKLAPFIRKHLKAAVASGALVQTKGKGANGSFRLSGGTTGAGKSASKPAKAKTAKPKAATTPKKAAKPKKSPQKSKPKKATPAKKAKPAAKTAAKKAKPVKIAKKKPAKASPKKKAAPKKAKK